jgi:TonB family protein
VLVDIVVLSDDRLLFRSVRAAVGERSPIWRARTAEEAVDLLLTGRCGVLLLDTAALSSDPAALITQFAQQFPDVITVVAGLQNDEAALSRLISDGLVYRFMHKPLSHKRANLFLQAAMERHLARSAERSAQSSIAGRLPVDSMPGAPLKWVLLALGLAAVVATMYAGFARRGPAPQALTQPTAQESTASQGRAAPVANPSAIQADPTLSRARAALDAGRLESPPGRNALDLFGSVLLARPDNAEAAAGLESTVARIVAVADQQAEAGDLNEAWRLLSRAVGAAPGNAAVRELSARLQAGQRRELASTSVSESRGTNEAAGTAAARPASKTAHADQPPRAAAGDPAGPLALAVPEPAGTPGSTAMNESSSPPEPAGEAPTAPATGGSGALQHAVSADPAALGFSSAKNDATGAFARGAPRAYGAPIDRMHPTAGYAEPVPAGSAALPGAGPDAAATPAGAVDSGPRLVAAADLVRRVAMEPVYPQQALRRGIEGWVEVEFTVTATGTVDDVIINGAQPRGVFDKSVRDALEGWEFQPYTADGRTAPLRSMITFKFELDD